MSRTPETTRLLRFDPPVVTHSGLRGDLYRGPSCPLGCPRLRDGPWRSRVYLPVNRDVYLRLPSVRLTPRSTTLGSFVGRLCRSYPVSGQSGVPLGRPFRDSPFGVDTGWWVRDGSSGRLPLLRRNTLSVDRSDSRVCSGVPHHSKGISVC